MKLLDKIRAKINGDKLHAFSLRGGSSIPIEHSDVIITCCYYACEKCGKRLYLEDFQINHLPYSMKIGCKK